MIGKKHPERNKRLERTALATTIVTLLLATVPPGATNEFEEDLELLAQPPQTSTFPPGRTVASSGTRPAFLASPADDPAHPIDEPEETMIARIELPVPKPVSEALHRESDFPAGQERDQEYLSTQGKRLVRNDASTPRIVFDDEQPGLQHEPEPAPSAPDPGVLLQQKRHAELEPIITQTRDARLAAALGWSLYNERKYSQSARWFQQSLEWDDQDYEAAYGLALALTRLGQYEKAEEVARWRLAEYPKMRDILGDIQTMRAVAAYKEKSYKRSNQLFKEVRQYRPLTRDEQILQAWNEFHEGNATVAGEEFERLYVESADKFAAGGVYAVYASRKDWDRLDELARKHGGPLEDMYKEYVAQRYYDRGLYRRAYAAAPEKFPELQNYTTPTVSGAAAVRFRSGNSGTSRLREARMEASGVLYQNDFHRLSARIGLTSLDAGQLSKSELVGTAPLSGDRRHRYGVKTSYDSLVDVRFRYDYQGPEYSPFVELGLSPAGGAVSPTVVGAAGIRADLDWGSWTGGIYRESIKDSILSYTGIRDPFTGETWGRVTESGVRLSLFLPIQEKWSAYGEFTGGVLEGENVESNTHVRFTLALNRQIDHPDFAYITVGPAFSFERYSENLSYFTHGHGGYFSPDYLFQATIGAHFLTTQGLPWLLKGDLDLGLQAYRLGSTRIFPLDGSPSVYPGSDDQTIMVATQLSGMVQLSPQWSLRGQVGFSRTANFNEFTAGLSLTYFFDPRAGLFASDFQTF